MAIWIILVISTIFAGTLAGLVVWDKVSMGQVAAQRPQATITYDDGSSEQGTGVTLHIEQKPTRKTDAYIQGYKDMAYHAQVPVTTKRRIQRDFSAYEYHDYLYHGNKVQDFYREVESETIVVDPNTNNPICPDDQLKKVAIAILDKGFKIDISGGQTSRKYLGGSDEDFQEYYKGGMEFVADVDEMKTSIMAERDEEKRIDRLIEERKRGLNSINTEVEFSIQALDELRNTTFSEQTFQEKWERQMNEVGKEA